MRESVRFLTKLVVVSLVGLLFFMFIGCFEDSPTDTDSVTITLTPFDTLTIGPTVSIQGTVTASPAVDETAFDIAVSDASGDVTTLYFDVNYSTLSEVLEEIDLNADLGLTIEALSDAPAGTYTFAMTVSAGSASSTKSFSFYVKGVTDPDLVVADLTLGSWQSTIGSSLEADAMVVYTTTEAAAISADIDIWYSNTADSADVLWSPLKAAEAQYAPQDWATKNATNMAKLPAGTDFDALTKQSQVDALWAGVTPENWIYGIVVGDVAILETNAGNIRVLKFMSGGGGLDNSQIVMKGKK